MYEYDLVFRIATAVALVVIYGISGYYRTRAERRGGRIDRSQGGPFLIAARVVFLLSLLPLLAYLVRPEWVAWARLDLPLWLRWLGVGLLVGVIPAVIWMFRSIGTNISSRHTTREGHQLVTSGPYRYIRHPLYTFGLLMYVGLGLVAAMWWIWLGLAVIFPMLMWRTPREEAQLVARFGDEYRAYMQRTGRYLPRLL